MPLTTVGASTDSGVSALFARGLEGEQRDFEMRLLSGSVGLPASGVTARFVGCGPGQNAKDFPAGVRGQIALIRRGGNAFKEKAKLAEAAGAGAAIIFNNLPGGFFGTLGDQTPDNPHPSIPVVCMTLPK